jgi:hypothetical protein
VNGCGEAIGYNLWQKMKRLIIKCKRGMNESLEQNKNSEDIGRERVHYYPDVDNGQ